MGARAPLPPDGWRRRTARRESARFGSRFRATTAASASWWRASRRRKTPRSTSPSCSLASSPTKGIRRRGASFARERVATPAIEYAESPREMLVAGRSVFAATSAADDAFPELRALVKTWGARSRRRDSPSRQAHRAVRNPRAPKRQRRPPCGGNGEGRPVRCRNSYYLTASSSWAPSPPVTRWPKRSRSFARCRARCGAGTRIFFAPVDAATLARSAAAGRPIERDLADDVRALGADARGACRRSRGVCPHHRGRGERLARPELRHRRGRNGLAVLGYRSGASVHPLLATRVRVHAQLWRDAPPRTKGKRAPPPAIVQAADVERSLEPRLRAALGGQTFTLKCEAGPTWRQGVSVTVETEARAPSTTRSAPWPPRCLTSR